MAAMANGSQRARKYKCNGVGVDEDQNQGGDILITTTLPQPSDEILSDEDCAIAHVYLILHPQGYHRRDVCLARSTGLFAFFNMINPSKRLRPSPFNSTRHRRS